MWRKNFGISFDVWDKILGTYDKVDWVPDAARARKSVLDYFRIRWV
jgi:sterol desaturase/sphingolipid hydroxylase (fatty acid hydroxylase superfamily)